VRHLFLFFFKKDCDICNLHVKVHQNKLQAKNIFLSHNPSAQWYASMAFFKTI